MASYTQGLPIDPVLPDLTALLSEHGAVVLVAAPGAGKSTRVAPTLCSDQGQVLLLQPRRLAARSLAARIAAEQGEELGEWVGYQVRHQRVGKADTRLWLLTEGILTRRLQSDPYLEGVHTVILDEFHERSLQVDIALAWLAALRRSLRPDLRVVVMSASIDPQPIAAFLDDCPVLRVEGREHPVQIAYAPRRARSHLVDDMLQGIERALKEVQEGAVLAFLPGVGEIKGCARALRGIEVCPLHGSLDAEEQDRALRPMAAGQRRVVLATNIAETSLTIPDVRAVVDSGLQRVASFDQERGLPVLRLQQISAWNALQRSGRAGRNGPGWCLRLWSRMEDQRLSESPSAEIKDADLAPLCMDLRQIHGNDLRSFPWFEAPADEHLQAAEALLAQLGLIEGPFAPLTAKGRYLAGLPIHPRLACLMLAAEQRKCLALGASVAALLSERRLCRHDSVAPIQAQYSDCEQDLYRLQYGGPGVDSAARRQVDLLRRDLLRRWRADTTPTDFSYEDRLDQLPALFLAAYPDRVGLRKAPGQNCCQWAGGSGEVAASSLFALRPGQRSGPDLCVAYLIHGKGGRQRQTTRVEGATIIDRELLATLYPDALSQTLEHHWNADKGRVDAVYVQRFGALILSYQVGARVDPEQAERLLSAYLEEHFEQQMQGFSEAWELWQRISWLAHHRPMQALEHILSQQGRQSLVRSWSQGFQSLAALPSPRSWIEASLGWQCLRELDSLAPAEIQLPGGRRRRLDYHRPEEAPLLRLRIQECFGWSDGPRVLNGGMAVVLELLAPNQRPQQRCNDLAGFWAGSYQRVRKDLRGRYPKHAWPEDPANAPAINK